MASSNIRYLSLHGHEWPFFVRNGWFHIKDPRNQASLERDDCWMVFMCLHKHLGLSKEEKRQMVREGTEPHCPDEVARLYANHIWIRDLEFYEDV